METGHIVNATICCDICHKEAETLYPGKYFSRGGLLCGDCAKLANSVRWDKPIHPIHMEVFIPNKRRRRNMAKQKEALEAKPRQARRTQEELLKAAEDDLQKRKDALAAKEKAVLAAQEATACKGKIASINLLISGWSSRGLSALLRHVETGQTEPEIPAPEPVGFTSIAGIAPPEPPAEN